MRYQFTLVRMAIINKSTNKVLERTWRKGNPSALLVGMQTGAATVENSMDFPQKTKDGTAFWPSNSTAGIITYEPWNTNPKEPMHPNVYSSTICIFFSMNCLFMSVAHFSIGLVAFSLLICNSSLYSKEISYLGIKLQICFLGYRSFTVVVICLIISPISHSEEVVK